MKKTSCIPFVVLMLMVCSAFVSCSKDDTREAEDESSIASLGALDYTIDGYYDGVLYYQITSNSENTAKIVKCSPSASAVMKIPSHVKINGKKYSITSVSSRAFDKCENISSLVIPNTVVSIGDHAFRDCRNLASVVFGKNVEYVGVFPFYGDGIDSESEGPYGSISRLEFADMESLCRIMCTTYINRDRHAKFYVQGEEVHDITIPNYVTSICAGAFWGCESFTSVSIGKNVTSIGAGAFKSSGLTSVVIEDGVASIGVGAFYGCYGLKAVTIKGNGVTSIERGAFMGCNNLTSLNIGSGVTSIGPMAFDGCNGLTSIMVDKNNPVYDSRENCNAIIETNSNTLVMGCKKTIIPGSIISIGAYAFQNCRDLTSLVIPNSVTSIGNRAFSGCSGLTSLNIPHNVVSIDAYAFENCRGLTSIKIEDSKNVLAFGREAFYKCPLTNLYLGRDISGIVFSTLSSLTISTSVTSIGDYAFQNCRKLTSLEIPNSVVSIGKDAFDGCNGLISLKIQDGIDDLEFNSSPIVGRSGFPSLETLYLGRNIKNNISQISPFEECTKLSLLTISKYVTSIAYSLFRGCSGLTSVTIPNSVINIERYAFQDCSGLSSVTIPNSVTTIGNGAFLGCHSLTSVTIPNSVTTIGVGAFAYSGLTSLVIPKSVTSIGALIAPWCNKLEWIKVEALNPPMVMKGDNSDDYSPCGFVTCPIYVPQNSVNAYKTAYSWKNDADRIQGF